MKRRTNRHIYIVRRMIVLLLALVTAFACGIDSGAITDIKADGTVTDFGQYITSAAVTKNVNGTWETVTSVTDKDDIKIALAYTIPKSIVTDKNKTIEYQLPNGIQLTEASNGTVYDGSAAIGTYTISADGLISIIFSDSFASDGDKFSGTVAFSGKASLSNSSEGQTINFGGDGGSLTVVPKTVPTDLTISKDGELNADKNSIDYTVTASSVNGTGDDAVNISDYLQYISGCTAKYKSGSFIITKYDANGNTTKITDKTAAIAADGKSFTISGLPALGAGEKYIVSYKADVSVQSDGTTNGSASVSNYAEGTSGNHSSNATSDVEVSKSMILKSGSYDPKTNLIDWVIDVNANGSDLSGYTLEDDLGTNVLSGDIKITDLNSSKQLATIQSFPYTFPLSENWGDFSKTDAYRFEYYTVGPESDGTSVSNTGKINHDGKSYSYTGSTNVEHPKGSVEKKYKEENNSTFDSADYSWTGTLTVPYGGMKAGDTAEYTDTIKNAILSDKAKTDLGNDSHYGIASVIDKAIRASSNTNISIDTITYYDGSGNEVEATDETSKVKSFKVIFKATGDVATGTSISITYPTHAVYTDIPEEQTATYENDGSAYGQTATDSKSHLKHAPLVKQSGKMGTDGKITYSSGASTFDYDSIGNKLYYRLLIYPDASTSGNIVITDTIPSGTSLDVNSVKAMFYASEYYEYSTVGQYDLTGSAKPKVTTDDSSFTVTIPDGYEAGSYQMKNGIVLTYTLSIADDTFWKDLTNTQKDYTNTAVWGKNTQSQTTTVKHNVPTVSKTGSQLTDADGNETNVVEYNVIMNPVAKDLDSSSDSLKLTDTLTTDKGTAEDVPASIKVYKYDSTKKDKIGEALGKNEWSYTYDQSKNILVFSVPDATALVITYQYCLNRGSVAGNISVNNGVSLNGTSQTSAQKSIVMREATSSATAAKAGNITVYKVDSENYAKTLPNAEFTLSHYDTSSKSWAIDDSSLKTDSNGTINWSLDTDTVLSNNLLYRLTETKAPTGYALKTQDTYFVWMTKNSTKDETISAMTNTAFSTVSTDNVLFMPHTGGSIYVPDEMTSVSAEKVWKDNEGNIIQNTSKLPSVKAQLYQQTFKHDGTKVNIAINNAYNDGNGTNVAKSTVYVTSGGSVTITVQADDYCGDSPFTDAGFTRVSGTDAGVRIYTKTYTNVTGDITEVTNGMNQYWGSLKNLTVTGDLVYSSTATANATAYGDPKTLSSGSNWKCTWSDLPKTDADGNAYKYTVVETPVSGYATSYSNNDGIQYGDITIINKSTGYELPDTGGSGWNGFAETGGALASAGFIGLYLINRRKREKEKKH